MRSSGCLIVCRWPWVTLTSQDHRSYYICVAFRVFVVSKLWDFKFGGQADHIKSQPTNDKPSLKRAWSRHATNCPYQVLALGRRTVSQINGRVKSYVTKLKFCGHNHNSGTSEATVTKFCAHVGRIKLVVMRWATYPLVGVVEVTLWRASPYEYLRWDTKASDHQTSQNLEPRVPHSAHHCQ